MADLNKTIATLDKKLNAMNVIGSHSEDAETDLIPPVYFLGVFL